MHWLLFYEYVEDVLERRGPHRPAHLDLVNEAHSRGTLVMAGALADPVDGAVFVFTGEDPTAAEEFVRADPYVANGLVTAWRIRRWTVVTQA